MDEFEIYFSDLTEEAQKSLLEAARIEDPSDMNWDVFPVVTFMIGADDD